MGAIGVTVGPRGRDGSHKHAKHTLHITHMTWAGSRGSQQGCADHEGSHTCDICQAQVTRISPGRGQGLDGVTVRSQGHVGVTFRLFHTDMASTHQAHT